MGALNSFSRTLRYLRGIACFPRQRRLGFLEMGLGIETRHEKFGRFWQPHLQACLEQQRSWLQSLGPPQTEPQALAVLGAGRLLDLATEEFQEHFSRITLIDGDPLSKKFWSFPSKAAISKRIIEVSGLIHPWSRKLAQLPSRDWEDTLRFLEDIPSEFSSGLPPGPALRSGPFQAVLSLNILSQIPIVWQNVVETELKKRFGLSTVLSKESEWIRAFVPSAKLLVEQHLSDLNNSRAENLLLISDLEYARYQSGRDYSRSPHISAPIAWQQSKKSWGPSASTPEEISCELQSALYGIDLSEAEVCKEYFGNYTLDSSSEWMWHIQPQGFEKRSSGLIHRVAAFQLSRANMH